MTTGADAARAEDDEYLSLLEARDGGEGLLDFIGRVSPHLPPPRHMIPIAAEFERARRERVRVCFSMPPGSAKTTLIQHAVAWWLSETPADACSYSTYADKLAKSKARRIRQIATTSGLKFARDANNLSEWRTQYGGGLIS